MRFAEIAESAGIGKIDDRNPVCVAQCAAAIASVTVATVRAAKTVVIRDDVVCTASIDESNRVAGRDRQKIGSENRLHAANIDDVQGRVRQ